jgi:hypothetical protein
MKTTALFLSLTLAGLSAHATIHQVDNNANSPGVYTTIQAAHNAASAGDTLYIHGSPTEYAAADIEKQLTIIGEGALPDKNFAFRTAIYSLTFKFNATNTVSSSGSRVYGCYFSYGIILGTNSAGTVAVNNITIQRNRTDYILLQGTGTNGTASSHTGILISNNVIYAIQGGVLHNSIIRNNIIGEVTALGNQSIGSWSLINNFIYGRLWQNRSAVISNNIVYTGNSDPFGLGGYYNEYCTITNNCIINISGVTLSNSDIIYGTNNGGNNLLNVDPLFVNTNSDLQSYSYTYPAEGSPMANLNLQPNSPCLAYGTDGTDLGIYGGAVPFFEGTPADSRYRYFPMPWIPAVLDMNIQNGSILPNGTLSVQFIGRKQD